MNQKTKGTNAERELIHILWSKGWAAFRAAGSGSIKYPVPDIIAGNVLRKVAIEVKSSSDTSIYIANKEIEDLINFCRLFGAEAWIAVRFSHEQFYFLNIEDIPKTQANRVITLETAKNKGLIAEEIFKKN